ncbi:DUF6884 domain-containing protein [Streptomyces anulatus]|uniref:DUF6884 domain-containing protein n=1 Tax=Streptomyces anulatus TaxID=1892 RepID=UPI002F911351
MNANTRDHGSDSEEYATMRCPSCGLRRPTEDGVLIDHPPTRRAAKNCPGSGAGRHTEQGSSHAISPPLGEGATSVLPPGASSLLGPGEAPDDLARRAGGPVVVVIPCSSKKRRLPAGSKGLPAAKLYCGPYFEKCLAAARAIPGSTILVVSARYGLITPETLIRPYDDRLNPRKVDHAKHRTQVAAMGQVVLHAQDVIALAGRHYADAAAAIWPHARRPLAGAAIGIQLQRLTRIAESDNPYASALDYAARALRR